VPAIIDSAPDCIIHVNGARPADDSADFILQAAYLKCQGIMTFGPGSTYGEDGAGAHGAYMVLTWIGIVVMVVVIVAWVLYEDRRLWRHVARIQARSARGPVAGAPGGPAAGVTEPPVGP
jgi:heme exporter protein D